MERALILVAALVASLTVTAPVGAAPDAGAGCGSSVLVLRTLHVEAKPSKKELERGEKFIVHVTVTRPAEEDPLGNGVTYERPTSTPAKDVTVGVAIWVGERTYFWGVGLTDENGKSDVKVKVPRNSEYGSAIASISGRHWLKRDCPDILEEGYANYVDFIRVVE